MCSEIGILQPEAADALALARAMKGQGLYRNTSGTAQSADALSTLKAGTGLGLAIVKHMLEVHGQTIHVRSSAGMGSTFGFTLNKAQT